MSGPHDLLLPYQADYADDAARWKFWLASRQIGKDFSSGFEGVRDCYQWELQKSRTEWMIAAPSERQSLDSLAQWKSWTEVFQLAIDDYREERETGGSEALLKSATIVFPHGSRITAVPGEPDTVRGKSTNVLLTEFAFFENPDLTWRAILPSITNPLRGGVKKVRIVTTPNGINNKAHDIFSKNFGVKDAKWSVHKTTIYDAVAAGLPVDPEEIKAAMDDPEGWAQEFECEFLDQQSVLLPYELIAKCESAEATIDAPSGYWSSSFANPHFIGIDFGRSRDLTVAWTCERLGDVLHTREILALDNVPTPDQVELLSTRIAKAQRVCLDYTGPGVGLGDYLVKTFQKYDPDEHKFGKIELLKFTNEKKVDVFSKLRIAFERERVRVPFNRTVREDLHSMNRVSTAGGLVTYKAPHTKDGHADRCTALALCVRIGASGAGPVAIASIERLPHAGSLGMGRAPMEVML